MLGICCSKVVATTLSLRSLSNFVTMLLLVEFVVARLPLRLVFAVYSEASEKRFFLYKSTTSDEALVDDELLRELLAFFF